MKTEFDAVAIGGGLAGTAFALCLARAGLRVAVIERTPFAKPKVCGDFLSREAQELLQQLGVDIWQMGAERISQFRLAAGHRAADALLPFTAAGLSRLSLDETLLMHAANAGAEIIRGQSVSALRPDTPTVTVTVADKTYTARYVALASGKHNLRGYQRSAGRLTALKMSFELSAAAREALSGAVQLFGYCGGYIGACHIENGASTLCWLADPAFMRRSNGQWQKQLAELARQSPQMEDLLADAKPLFDKPATTTAIPFGYQRCDPIGTTVYPLGDQLAVIPSFTGDGTSIALTSGIKAAEAILSGCHAGNFQRSFLRGLQGQFRWAGIVDLAFKSRLSRRLGISAINVFPGLATQLARRTRLAEIPALANILQIENDKISAEARSKRGQ